MARLKVYLDTSVISYLDQTDTPEKMKLTQEVWERLKTNVYDVFISNVVLNELRACSEEKFETLMEHLEQIEYTVVTVNEESIALADKIVEMGVLKKKSIVDCQHIAAAIVSNCDFLMSWNFKHIVSTDTIKGIKVLTTLEGYKDILIYSPEAFTESED